VTQKSDMVRSNIQVMLKLASFNESDFEINRERSLLFKGHQFHYNCFLTQMIELYDCPFTTWIIEKIENSDITTTSVCSDNENE